MSSHLRQAWRTLSRVAYTVVREDNGVEVVNVDCPSGYESGAWAKQQAGETDHKLVLIQSDSDMPELAPSKRVYLPACICGDSATWYSYPNRHKAATKFWQRHTQTEPWRTASSSSVPTQPPDSASVPSGHYILWHRTALGNADSIRRSGLGAQYSRQFDFTGEMVWGTRGFRSAVDVQTAPQSDWAFIEYHVPWDPNADRPSEGGAYTSGSVPPSDIINIWEPWHFAVWILSEEIRSGSYTLENLEFMRSENAAWAKALDWLSRNEAPSWMRSMKP